MKKTQQSELFQQKNQTSYPIKKQSANRYNRTNANLAKNSRFGIGIEPWMDQPGTIPYSLFNTQQQNENSKIQEPVKLKKYNSTNAPLVPIKTYLKRQTKNIPRMDISSPKKYRSQRIIAHHDTNSQANLENSPQLKQKRKNREHSKQLFRKRTQQMKSNREASIKKISSDKELSKMIVRNVQRELSIEMKLYRMKIRISNQFSVDKDRRCCSQKIINNSKHISTSPVKRNFENQHMQTARKSLRQLVQQKQKNKQQEISPTRLNLTNRHRNVKTNNFGLLF